MRICSLLPSATEIIHALGLGDQLVAVTHECDEPPAARATPRITRGVIDPAALTSAQIDALVSESVHDHRGIYHLDRDLLERRDPDLILTQELCDVWAVSYDEAAAAPEVAVLMPCGFDVDRAEAEYRQASLPPQWWETPAARAGEVRAVNANANFSRPGPRLVDGLEALAAILHPEGFGDGLDPVHARRVQRGP